MAGRYGNVKLVLGESALGVGSDIVELDGANMPQKTPLSIIHHALECRGAFHRPKSMRRKWCRP
jgi:hypothetical protein